VFLKVKQADNNDFSFLNPSDELHGYYLYLKRKHSGGNDAGGKAPAKDDQSNSGESDSGNPLSGLLGGYSSSSSEDGSGDGVNDSKFAETATVKGSEETSTMDTQVQKDGDEGDKKRKADRLERLRLWKESKMNQTTT